MKHLNRLPLLAVLLAVPLLMAPAVQIPEKLTDGSFAAACAETEVSAQGCRPGVGRVGIGGEAVYPETTRFVTTQWLVKVKMSHERRAR
jgi:hypothetical protein